MRIGIFFGGPSREREISFAGGRTVYDNLDKSLFEPVPIFVDSNLRFIRLDWNFLYKGTIRDFYPPVAFLPPSSHQFQIYAESLEGLSEAEWQSLMACVGQPLRMDELAQHMDFAFLALHGSFGEDGQIQGILDALKIPYSGSGIRPAALGMDKAFQKKLMEAGGFSLPEMEVLTRHAWLADAEKCLQNLPLQTLGWPLVVRPANQGSSIGVSIVKKESDLKEAIDSAFFMRRLDLKLWRERGEDLQVRDLRQWTDIRHGLGFPLWVSHPNSSERHRIAQPETLLRYLQACPYEQALLEAVHSEHRIVLESFIQGREFSCVVVRDEVGQALALPPTGIRKGQEVFDYRSKYLAGLASKVTPIDLPLPEVEAICAECVRLFDYLEFDVYARIDGFYTEQGDIILNDPNTTSGMLPSSFFFHQAAEIGLNPSAFLTYIIHRSLLDREAQNPYLHGHQNLLKQLEQGLQQAQSAEEKPSIAVLLGGYSSERHISVESGRNIYEKLASSGRYRPLPIFLTRNPENQALELWELPINTLLKDNADDILEKIRHFELHPFLPALRERSSNLRKQYLSQAPLFAPQALSFEDLAQRVQAVFIALHGRPGEDGEVQARLEALGLPYNGSQPDAAALTIDKYRTLQTLRQAGFATALQCLVSDEEFFEYPQLTLDKVEAQIEYPLIAKPMDDGCSSAVKKIHNREELAIYLQALFRQADILAPEVREALGIKDKEEFPQKQVALLESLIDKGQALHFLEVTGGLLTHYQADGSLVYEVFEPSETLASGAILSLEEKFLAGEGQNLTPARFTHPKLPGLSHEAISSQVRQTLEAAARQLGVTGYARIDAFVRIYADERVETLIIEVNSLPGMTPATCIFHQCALNQYKPYEFIEAILDFGKQRQAKQV